MNERKTEYIGTRKPEGHFLKVDCYDVTLANGQRVNVEVSSLTELMRHYSSRDKSPDKKTNF